jgi:YHS domain-containing protein
VSKVLPQFDPLSRTFKVRVEMDNPGYIFRPDMFVDVELPVNLPDSLTVPGSAVIDTGSRKTVFVDRGNGYFEPRRVETGWRFGDRIEITKGLMEGEQIVVSGNFLVDSESRMKLAAAGLPEDHELDPVCGMGVDPKKAGEKKSVYRGQTYYFCNPDCKAKFDAAPEKYRQKNSEVRSQKSEGSGKGQAEGKTARDLVCGMDVDATVSGVLKAEYQGKTYYFCNPSCKETFLNNPAKYLPK